MKLEGEVERGGERKRREREAGWRGKGTKGRWQMGWESGKVPLQMNKRKRKKNNTGKT
jgi:hypothetical protein